LQHLKKVKVLVSYSCRVHPITALLQQGTRSDFMIGVGVGVETKYFAAHLPRKITSPESAFPTFSTIMWF
jgi:hypothetical protein